jgi:hypothetical protein
VCSKIFKPSFDRVISRASVFMTSAILMACGQVEASTYRDLGYLYLSPLPGAEYVSPQTRFVLVRFEQISPLTVTNLTTTFITVSGERTGTHIGRARVAHDDRTVVFEMVGEFADHELVTVELAPEVGAGSGEIAPYSYAFMVSGPMPGVVPATLEAAPVIELTPVAPSNGDTSVPVPVNGAIERMDVQRMDDSRRSKSLSTTSHRRIICLSIITLRNSTIP